jgi:predicted DsbA family dithiol-disulfide isomerase
MYDDLFDHQPGLDDAHLHECATDLGLDVDRFDQDMTVHRSARRIKKDLEGGTESGVL